MPFFEENKKYILASTVLVLVVAGFVGGYFFARAGYSVAFFPLKFVDLNRENAPKTVDWQILWDAMNAVNSKFVDGPVDQQQLLYGAVSGLVNSLNDPYTVFMTPTKSEQFQQDLRGEFSGIGAEIGMRNNQVTIIAPLEGSPAEKAGLKALDQILEIDGQSTEKMSLDDAVNKIRGPKDSAVVLTYFRDGFKAPQKVTIIRDTIVVPSVSMQIKDVNGKKIGVIKLSRYGEDTKQLLDDKITQILAQNVQGVILDERNNPGGYITSAVDVASNWVKSGQVVVSEQFRDGKKDDYTASGVARLAGLPTAVLVNEGSASASEIVAGALKDYGLATLIGKKTFGKGSVQELVNLPDGADLKVTVAKWLTPNGKNINTEGITPDIDVEITQADIDAFRDPQLDKALEFVGTKIK